VGGPEGPTVEADAALNAARRRATAPGVPSDMTTEHDPYEAGLGFAVAR